MVNGIAFVRRVGFLVLRVVVVPRLVSVWVVSVAVLSVGVVLVVVVERVVVLVAVLSVVVVLVRQGLVVRCCDPMPRWSLSLALVVQ